MTEPPIIPEGSRPLPKPVVAARRHLALIWLLPLLALTLGGWLVWRSLLDMGPQIEIEFDNGDGIVVNQTQVHYKGIAVGVVKRVRVKDNLSGVVATVQMDKGVAEHLGGVPAEAQFWLVQPQVTLAGVSGLNALFSGNYIGLSIPQQTSGAFARYFVALKEAPPMPLSEPGLHIRFKADRLGSIGAGTPILFRQIQIGSVKNTAMAPDNSGVLIEAHILPEYQQLVHRNTRFWNSSGVRIDGGLGGVHVQTESLATLLAGGIAMSAPNEDAPASNNGDEFQLYGDFEAAEASVYANVQFASAEGLTKGVTRVMYKGMAVGRLLDVWYDKGKDVVIGRFGLDPRFESFITDRTRFWLVRPQLSAAGVSGLDALISGAYLAFAPDDSGQPVRDHDFVAANGPAEFDFREPGLHLTLQSEKLGSLTVGAPVYYQQLPVGSVQSYVFDNQLMNVHILVKPEYRYLVNSETRFWNVSGLRINSGAGGLQIEGGTLPSLIAGGIAFDTPATGNKVREVHDGDHFPLHERQPPLPPSAPGLHLQLEAADAAGLSVGAPLLYRELPVGSVQDIHFSADGSHVVIDAHIAPEHAQRLAASGVLGSATRFWRVGGIEVSGGLSGINVRTGSLANLIAGGIAFDRMEAGDDKPAALKNPGGLKNGDRCRLYRDRPAAEHAGFSVTLTLASAEGLSPGAAIRYRGLPVGEIDQLRFGNGLNAVIASASIHSDAAALFVSGTRLWQVSPVLGLARTEHLDAVVGTYIALRPPVVAKEPAKPQREFVVLPQEPVNTASESGLNLLLTSARLGSLKAGDPLLYRQVRVGRVLGADLNERGDGVNIYVNIEPSYQHLVRTSTRFWHASGVHVEAGLLKGVEVQTESLETLASGGIAFATPAADALAKAGSRFELADEPDPAWQNWRPDLSPH